MRNNLINLQSDAHSSTCRSESRHGECDKGPQDGGGSGEKPCAVGPAYAVALSRAFCSTFSQKLIAYSAYSAGSMGTVDMSLLNLRGLATMRCPTERLFEYRQYAVLLDPYVVI